MVILQSPTFLEGSPGGSSRSGMPARQVLVPSIRVRMGVGVVPVGEVCLPHEKGP